MAEPPPGSGGSPGPAAPPSPGGSAGPQEDERCPGGGSPESGGAAPDSEFLKPPWSKKRTPSSSGKKKRAAGRGQPGNYRDQPLNYRDKGSDQPLDYRDLSPIVTSPQGKRRSWRRSSLKGRSSRRKSLPPVHRDVTELSQSISLELPEIQRLQALLLSSFQFSARKLQQILEANEGFDAQIFGAKVQAGSEDLQRLLQRLLQDGTLGSCVELPPGDSLDPALGGAVAQVKDTMARLSAELQAWAELLRQQQQRASESSRNLELLKSGSSPQPPPGSPKNPKILEILGSKPNYEEILRETWEIPRALSVSVDEVCQAGDLLLQFREESERFLTELSRELAHRTFRNLPPSPARKLLQPKPQRAKSVESQK